MTVEIVREPEIATQLVVQGLWLQGVALPHQRTVTSILSWALEILSSGQPLIPIGVLADIGHLAFGTNVPLRQRRSVPIPGFPSELMRAYEDHLIGRLQIDASFERASDALRRFTGRDRMIGLAYLVRQFRENALLGGLEMPPGIIRALLEMAPEEVLRRGWTALAEQGPMPLLVSQIEGIVKAARRLGEVLTREDVRALEQRTALADVGQYVAHRQVLQTARRLEERLPRHPPGRRREPRDLATPIADEDTYPVGGFASISTRGSPESLLHSQLAYMETDPTLRPDLFDVKFVRDELFYYARDEGQFLRQRRSFIFYLHSDLVRARFKDPELPVQRIIMVLATLYAAVQKLSQWLSTAALNFDFLMGDSEREPALHHEQELLTMLFRERIENQSVKIRRAESSVVDEVEKIAQKRRCYLLTASTMPLGWKTRFAATAELIVPGPRPRILSGRFAWEASEDDCMACWSGALEELLRHWL